MDGWACELTWGANGALAAGQEEAWTECGVRASSLPGAGAGLTLEARPSLNRL